jgi:CHRD domain
MRRYHLTATALAAAVVAFSASYAGAQEFTAHLKGFNEIGSIPNGPTYAQSYTGAILSVGEGTATLDLDKKAGTIAYKLTYSNVGTTPPLTGTVRFAHIHFGKSRDSGGILVFFCTHEAFTGTGPTPPDCPSPSATVTGMWTKADVQAIGGQNVAAGDFDALVDALESNTAYANIHTTALGGGEIRGQVRSKEEEEEEQREHQQK